MTTAGYQFMVFAGDGSNSFSGVRSIKGKTIASPFVSVDTVSIGIPLLQTMLPFFSSDPLLLALGQLQFNFAHAMPQSNRQASHDRNQCDLLLFRIAQHQLLIAPPTLRIMTDMDPTGLA